MFPDFNGPSCLFHANIHVTADIFKLSNTFNPIHNGGGEGWGAPNIIFLLNPKKVKGKVINFFVFIYKQPQNYVLGTLSNKKNDIIWEFFPNVGPPPTPPFGNPLSKKIFQCLFCILEPKEHFCSSKKNHFLGGILVNLLKVLGIGDPPPFWEKFPNNPVFFFLQQDNSDNFEYP